MDELTPLAIAAAERLEASARKLRRHDPKLAMQIDKIAARLREANTDCQAANALIAKSYAGQL